MTCLLDKDMIRESINKIKNGKEAGPSSVVSEMVKAAREKVDMITDLVNQIIVGVIPEEWELCTSVNHYKGKGPLKGDRD